MANIAIQRIKREFTEVLRSEEVIVRCSAQSIFKLTLTFIWVLV